MKLEKKLIVLSAVGFLALLLTYQFGSARALYPGAFDYVNHAPNEAVVAFYGSVALAATVLWRVDFLTILINVLFLAVLFKFGLFAALFGLWIFVWFCEKTTGFLILRPPRS